MNVRELLVVTALISIFSVAQRCLGDEVKDAPATLPDARVSAERIELLGSGAVRQDDVAENRQTNNKVISDPGVVPPATSTASSPSASSPQSAAAASATSATSATVLTPVPPAVNGLDVLEKSINYKYTGHKNNAMNPARISFKLLPDGTLKNGYVYNSCGNHEIDEAVVKAVTNLKNCSLCGLNLSLLAVLPPGKSVLKIESVPMVDFTSFLNKVQLSIKAAWHPGKANSSTRASSNFILWHDGKVTDIHFDPPSDDSALEGASRAALTNFVRVPFPANAPDQVPMRFVFAYNVTQRDGNGTTLYAAPPTSTRVHRPIAAQTENVGSVRNPRFLECNELMNEGLNALNAKNFGIAITRFQAVLRIDPSHRLARINLAIAHNNYGLARLTNLPFALSEFHQALFIDPSNRTTLQNVNHIVTAMGKSPVSFADRKALGADAEAKHDYIGAIIEYGEACRIKDDGECRVHMGDMFSLRHDNDASMVQYLTAKRLNYSGADAKIAELTSKLKSSPVGRTSK